MHSPHSNARFVSHLYSTYTHHDLMGNPRMIGYTVCMYIHSISLHTRVSAKSTHLEFIKHQREIQINPIGIQHVERHGDGGGRNSREIMPVCVGILDMVFNDRAIAGRACEYVLSFEYRSVRATLETCHLYRKPGLTEAKG